MEDWEKLTEAQWEGCVEAKPEEGNREETAEMATAHRTLCASACACVCTPVLRVRPCARSRLKLRAIHLLPKVTAESQEGGGEMNETSGQ